MEVHDKVANFSLQNQDEQTVQLTDFAGKPVVSPVPELKDMAVNSAGRLR